MIILNKYIVFIFCCFISVTLSAQPDLEGSQVEIIKNFDAQLSEASKLYLTPVLPPLDTSSQQLIYNLPTQTLEVDYPAPTIRPIAMRSEATPPSYKGYGKIGYGIPRSPYAELSYFDKISDNLFVGGKAQHHSANNSNNLDNQRFSETGGSVEGTYYFLEQGFEVGSNIGFNQNNRFFYGYDHEVETFTKDEVRQRFNTFDFGVDFRNSERTQGDLNYWAEFDFYRLTDRFASKESGTDILIGLNKFINEKHPVGIILHGDFTKFTDNSERSQTLNNFLIQPSFGFHANRFKVDIGANLIASADAFTVYPDIEASLNILGTRLAAFAGWEGNFVKNSFQDLTNYNPFLVSSGFDIRNSKYQEFYGGVKGNANIVEYQGKVGIKNVDNLALFINNFDDTKRFDVLYDTAQIVVIEGTIGLNIIEELEVSGMIRSNIFTLENQQKPWHLPSFETNVSLRYTTLQDRLLFKTELFLQNGVTAVTPDLFEEKLNALFDLSFGAEYWFSPNFGAFADVNNLFNNKLERWQNYPGIGLNVMAGVTGRF